MQLSAKNVHLGWDAYHLVIVREPSYKVKITQIYFASHCQINLVISF